MDKEQRIYELKQQLANAQRLTASAEKVVHEAARKANEAEREQKLLETELRVALLNKEDYQRLLKIVIHASAAKRHLEAAPELITCLDMEFNLHCGKVTYALKVLNEFLAYHGGDEKGGDDEA